MEKITSIIIEKLYPVVAKLVESRDRYLKAHVNKFMQTNNAQIFDIAPYNNIMYNTKDRDELFTALGISEASIASIVKDVYFMTIPAFNPQCAKEPYVLVVYCIIRYYLKQKKRKEAEFFTIYLVFSGKFYASLWYKYFSKVPPSKHKEVMDYVINNMLNNKFDLKREGTVYGAIKCLVITYLDKYQDFYCKNDLDDEDVAKGQGIQQLHDRLNSLLYNISSLYYEAYTNKYYMNYETDNVDEDHYRLTSSDATTAARLTEAAMNYITSTYVSLEICEKCKDVNVKALEVKDIIEAIFGDNNNLPQVRRVINILICDFMRNYPGVRVGGIEFIAYSLKAKPNTKDKYLLELKETITSWLDENSHNYRKRKSRQATAVSYYRSILTYFVLVINKVANK